MRVLALFFFIGSLAFAEVNDCATLCNGHESSNECMACCTPNGSKCTVPGLPGQIPPTAIQLPSGATPPPDSDHHWLHRFSMWFSTWFWQRELLRHEEAVLRREEERVAWQRMHPPVNPAPAAPSGSGSATTPTSPGSTQSNATTASATLPKGQAATIAPPAQIPMYRAQLAAYHPALAPASTTTSAVRSARGAQSFEAARAQRNHQMLAKSASANAAAASTASSATATTGHQSGHRHGTHKK